MCSLKPLQEILVVRILTDRAACAKYFKLEQLVSFLKHVNVSSETLSILEVPQTFKSSDLIIQLP